MIYGRDDILEINLPEEFETAFIESNFRKSKWLLSATYLSFSQNHGYPFDNVDKG